MSSIKETTKNKTKIKKGFTIIEMVIVISLTGILINLPIIAISKYMKLHREEMNYSRENFYVNEAFIIIENEMKNAKYVDIKDNMIILRRYDNKGYDYIRQNKGTAIVISYGAINSSNVNNILKDIKDFKLERREKIFYISIKMKRGDLYRRCFAIEREKLRKDSY
ncbi:competence type IV pilus minor pilin ComGF [Clostridium sp. BJN0013]|uniref:competence type IV pilus minor pilin ComGF n=1 Tax=Clostridium sp. BJN0013 TaxID=3236840 RepID=UPI0034C68FFC